MNQLFYLSTAFRVHSDDFFFPNSKPEAKPVATMNETENQEEQEMKELPFQ